MRPGLLILHAGRLVFAAQSVGKGRAVPQLLDRMCRLRGLPFAVDSAEGYLAVARAASRLRLLGQIDTCLIRSLALAALLADQKDVQVHLGFRPSDSTEAVLAGHAWVTLGGRALPDDRAALVDGQSADEVVVLRASRVKSSRVIQELP